jgi:2',3'-cyclic-nucleotide 2'-phosphodiesterase / 3'-nucleotidase
VLAAVAWLVAVAHPGTAGQARITILSTTDLHGNLLPIDYYTGKADTLGLAKVASLIRTARRENPTGTLLLDSGDMIQGSPLEYVHDVVNNAPVDPMMRAMNALGYDAVAVGNHEYNHGLVVLEKARREARFPWLSSNTYDKGGSRTHYLPYIVKVLNGVRVGVLGLTTPDVPLWEDRKNYVGLEFHDPLAEARRWVPVLRDREHVDVVVIAMHMGLEEDPATGNRLPQLPNENEALAIARQVSGVDVILMGHTHRDVPSLVVNGVLMTQAELWGRRLSKVDLALVKDGRTWRISSSAARTIPVTTETPVDPEIAAIAQPYDRETNVWLQRTIGESDAELTLRNARFEDSALLDLVQRVQLDAGTADVSMAAVFNLDARLPKGSVSVRDIAGLYVYDNTLVVLEVTGQQLKDALEYSARYFREYTAGSTPADLVDSRIPAYNFDVAEGVTYTLNIAKPFGQRIQDLRFKGEPLDPARRLRLATNNYRANGGGGYDMYKGAPEIFRSSKEIRDMIIEWVEQHHQVPSQPSGNWQLVATP